MTVFHIIIDWKRNFINCKYQQNLIKMSSDNFRFEKGIKIQSRGIALMCNESISLI